MNSYHPPLWKRCVAQSGTSVVLLRHSARDWPTVGTRVRTITDSARYPLMGMNRGKCMNVLKQLQSTHAESGKLDIRIINIFFWEWYHNHRDTVLLKRKVFLFSVTIRVRDLYELFVQLFGDEPPNGIIR